MKRIYSLFLGLLCALTLFAQKDVTTFLGIPVDGSKTAMRQKLIAKGFTPKKVRTTEFLTGEFNGGKVDVHIVTNNNKVCRIMVSDVTPVSEADIKIRFNNLVNQFEKNSRYLTVHENAIPEDEDISFQMLVKKKNYDASFYQRPEQIDTLALQEIVKKELLSKYTEEQLNNSTPAMEEEMQAIIVKIGAELFSKKHVWFRIMEEGYDKYTITMYYDNEYNRSNGEDL